MVNCRHSFSLFQPMMPVVFETVKGNTLRREMMANCFSPRFPAIYQTESPSISVLESFLGLVILVELKMTIAGSTKVEKGETLAT
jgi:hypothetical protein